LLDVEEEAKDAVAGVREERRQAALSYGDYASMRLITGFEQLMFLLFLKMADEQSKPPFDKRSPIPKDFDWPSFLKRDGDELETHCRHVLESLAKRRACSGSYSARRRTRCRTRRSSGG